MGNLYLVRHGQASFGETDYDKLSALGHQQSVRLGEYFAAKGVAFDAVVTGTLRRHTETFAGITQGMGLQTEALQWPGLNEYDSEAVIATIHPDKLEKPTSPEMYRQHFRLLRDGLKVDGWRGQPPRHAQLQRLRGRRHRRAGPCARPGGRRWAERDDGVQRWPHRHRRGPCAGHQRPKPSSS
jgi:broad specificity phosphatase PhoE